MPWLDFANHFLSNQSLHAWSWINRTFSWEWCFLVECLALRVFGLFLFCFCLVWGEQATDAQDFWLAIKRERTTLDCGFPSFFVYLVTTLYCSDIVWSKDLSAYLFCFLSILDREFSFLSFLLSFNLWLRIFSFCFLPLFWLETFLFFVFFRGQGLTFSPWVTVYGKLGFWLKAYRTVGHDICQCLVWFKDKRGCPTLFPWHKCNNDDLEILCETSHACTYVDTQVSKKNFGHVMLGLIIHFLYFSQPSVSKICSAINLCIHRSLFWVFEKTFTAFTLQMYTHFFQNWLWSMNSFT